MRNQRGALGKKNYDVTSYNKYKELLKEKQDTQNRIANTKNPFAKSIKQTDHQAYKQLYKFDAKNQMSQYDLSFGKQIETDKKKSRLKPIKTKHSFEEEVMQEDQEIGSPELMESQIEVNYTNTVKGLFDQKQHKPVNKIQNSQFVDRAVYNELTKIKTGQDAISFFAKYGNTTPIKFINCEATKESYPFRPYDLKVVSTSETQKELIMDQYYTISSHGIVRAYTESYKKKRSTLIQLEGNLDDISTEVISLSQWMHDSTLFNIITNIQFFKQYAKTKIFNRWKTKMREKMFAKTRKKLVYDSFLAKPAFCKHLMKVNQCLFTLQLHKTMSANITHNKTWQAQDFKEDQRNSRTFAYKQYTAVTNGIKDQVKIVCQQVVKRTNVKQQEGEDVRFDQQIKKKPMNQIRKQKQQNQYLLDIAIKDKNRLRSFIQLIDYITVQTLVSINHSSMKMLLEQMKKQRKTGLFNITIMEEKMSFKPDQNQIKDLLDSTLRDMIQVAKNVPRIINSCDQLKEHLKTGLQDQKVESSADVSRIINDSLDYIQLRKQMFQKASKDFKIAQDYIDDNYQKCREIISFMGTFTMPDWQREQVSFEQIRANIKKFNDWNSDIKARIKDIAKGILNINGAKIATRLTSYLQTNLKTYKQQLNKLMTKKLKQTKDKVLKYTRTLEQGFQILKDYGNYITDFTNISSDNKKIQMDKNQIETMQAQLKRLEGSVRTADAQELQLLKNLFNKLQLQIQNAGNNIKEKSNQMKQSLNTQIVAVSRQIKKYQNNLMTSKVIDQTCEPSQALRQLQDIKRTIDRIKLKNQENSKLKVLMELPVQKNKQLQELQNKFNDRKLLWTHVAQFKECQSQWTHTPMQNLNSEDVLKEMQTFQSTIMQLKLRIGNLSKQPNDKVLDMHQARIKKYKTFLPLIVALSNQDLRNRHWRKIFQLLDNPGQIKQKPNLDDLLALKAMQKLQAIQQISARASGQAGIQSQVKQISDKWSQLFFVVNPYRDYKDKFIIGSVQQVMQTLDDHQLKIQSMMGSRFVAQIRGQVQDWAKKLLLISQIIDQWLACQRQWMYLQNIFTAQDIQKQLPQQTTKFFIVDKFWKETMIKTNKRPMVQQCCSSQQLLKKFQKNNKELEDIQKSLEYYLQTKRAAFPRFYFLSNDQLLQILSQTRNPHAVQGHLRKCFENINKIQFTDVQESREIISMISAEPEVKPEKVMFSSSVFAEGAVEHWLMRIQEMMIQSLYDIVKQSIKQYPQNPLQRKQWLFSYAAQLVLVVDLIKWTQGAELAIIAQKEGDPLGVDKYDKFMKELISKMVGIVREDLNILQRTLMGALIVLDVHARQVVYQMSLKKVSDLNDFQWAKQLRYYWQVQLDNCVVRQTNTHFKYGYQYLGNGPRLVITPLTDKCYMTLTGAKHLQFGGAPAGPAGTGKTQSTKDLAKALAIQCVVFNCSDGLDFKIMGRFFSGLAQGGAWACFDQFNRIDIQVLSVIAQQILTIQQAIKRDQSQFQFEGRVIPINHKFGVFITMNPGYAGRTQLPDNLKALFRPVAMMIPDYALIAQIILFSQGFQTAKILAKKMVQLYKLSSQQLSKQDHYDFGMRAVKSVLVMAGALRRKQSTLAQDVVLIRAMRDSNIPKFLQHDLPLFMGIISDLFPSVQIPNIDYGNLQKAIQNQLEIVHYQKPKRFITKIIQLMETIMVRHGLMVVGLTGTGKTTLISTLAKALGQLNTQGSQDYYHKHVKMERMNPKSVLMNQLFGYTNILTNQWTDGIVAAIVRSNVADTTDTKKWIIFDGPVDALWIQNMNTVLDDNKMLCLSNGQRIKLPATFTMMFEVNDLAVASPATVSRCGMVYMQPIHLGWQPLIQTWSYHFRQANKKQTGVPTYINNLIQKIRTFFKQNLQFIRQQCKQMIVTQDSNLVTGCINILMVLFDELSTKNGIVLEKLSNVDSQTICSMLAIFSFIWSTGANLHDNPKDNSRVKFSQHIKTKIRKFFSGYPYEGQVYDYYIDFSKKQFKPWTELVTQFKYVKDMPYFNILVQTADTVKYKYILSHLTDGKKNTLITGDTGVGKSVIISQFVGSLSSEQYTYVTLNFSAQTSTKNLLDVFLDKDKFTKKRRNQIGPLGGRKMVMFVDDINMPALERYGAQPPNQLLRQIIDMGGFYDLKKFILMEVSGVNFVAACAPPGGGRNQVTPRLFRHFNMIWAPDLSVRSMQTIFSAILRGFLSESTNRGLQKFAPYIVKSSVQIYGKIRNQLLPTPTKSHYTFNLRDLSKVFQGILQIKYQHLNSKQMLVNLWCHQSQRVFFDRLVDEKDRQWFLVLSQTFIKNTFEYQYQLKYMRQILFGDYLSSVPMYGDYQKIQNHDVLSKRFTDFLNQYNAEGNKTMNLVFFKDAIMHLSRLCRILRQQRGNALLVGVGGSGRQSLTRLASSIRGFKQTFSIEITKNYRDGAWKQDIKKCLKKAGKEMLTFLFSDTQIVKQSFLQDLNNVLNTGEVPNLWGAEDVDQIMNQMREYIKQQKLNIFDNRENMMKLFNQLTRQNLHIVLAFSPVGQKLRNRCRQFPSIINCCTIDWFQRWPSQALYSVAQRQYKAQQALGIGQFVQKLSQLSVEIHIDVIQYSQRYYSQLRRRNYVTPTSYLELLKLYIDMMKEQQKILPAKIQKYTVGLQTLRQTNIVVEELKQKIIQFQPILQKSAKENAEMVIQLEKQSKIASETQEQCSAEAAVAQKQRDQVNQLKNICKSDLDQMIPILRKAEKAVAAVDQKQIKGMKTMVSPPKLVEKVMNAVCLLLKFEQTWDSAKKNFFLLIKPKQALQKVKASSIPEKTIKKLRKNYLEDPDFVQQKVRNVSQQCQSICIWIKSMDKLYDVQKKVQPKQKKLNEAEDALKIVEDQLGIKQSKLKEIQDKLATLQKKYDASVRKAQALQQQKETAAIQLVRAQKLVGGLSGQAERWKLNAAKLTQDLKNLVGNILLASASIAYIGPFTTQFRQQMIKHWIQKCKDLQIPVSEDYLLQRILTQQVQVRQWQENGLPSDSLSVDNGIFMYNCKRWPLIIDPQGQANKWIRNIGKESNIHITKLTQGNFLKILQNAIRNGQPVLMENVQEQLDPSLEPILTKQIVRKGAQYLLRIGDQNIPYNFQFKFYMTTKLPNPHYIPEISIKTTIINFTVTPGGLQDQLLSEVVRFERIELQTKRIELMLQISQDKRQLQQLEDKILRQIGEAQGRILDDEQLINTLDASKVTSDAVNTRIQQSRITSEQINKARQQYRSIARRGSVIYFVISDLALIDPMYQYSLEFFVNLFKRRLELTPKKENLSQRRNLLVEDITINFYINICRGLFEKDKLLYSFLIATKIQLAANKINFKEWNYFLRGALKEADVNLDEQPSFISEKIYRDLGSLTVLTPSFRITMDQIKSPDNKQKWIDLIQMQNPIQENLPTNLDNRLDYFQKMLLYKVLKQEKLMFFIKYYVKNILGKQFIQSPAFDLKGSYADSTSMTPIIFVLSPGADPIAYLISLSKQKEMDSRLKMLSLGQGQGQIAKEHIKAGRRNGDWVCLQNCHLALTWMAQLQRIQQIQVQADTHADFRLWLTSMPTPKFPVPVLQSGIKLTNQPPKGLKANLARTYNEVTQTNYSLCTKPNQFKKLLFSLAFFHAVILQRRKFGAIGWNISYQWMNSDFDTCQLQLRMYLDEQPGIPWDTLWYLIAQINYGGRVTDDKDVRLIIALLVKYFNHNIIEGPFKFSKSGIYRSPQNLQLNQIKEYIAGLPLQDQPQIYGLHTNANITFQQKNVRDFFQTLLSVQPRVAGGNQSGESQDQIIQKLAQEMQGKVPQLLLVKKIQNPISLDIFRAQQVDRFNILLKVLKRSIIDLQKAIKGTNVMSIQLEMMYQSFINKKVPDNWEKVAYPSLKPLASWFNDLIQRVIFFRKWVQKYSMQSYWVSSMFFPQGFMTAVMQTYARKTLISIDSLQFKSIVLPFFKNDVQKQPQIGVNIHGMFSQGCQCDPKNGTLTQSKPKQLFFQMPVIWLKPITEEEKQENQMTYNCPVYKTSTRKGVLSTTGHSTNFVMYLKFQSKQTPAHWVRRGVALLCQLDD